MFGSKMMSSGGKPTFSREELVGARGRSRSGARACRPGPSRRTPSPPPPRRSGGASRACRRNSSSPSFMRDRVDDRLALHALQPGLDHAPLRAVDHHRHARDVGLGGDEAAGTSPSPSAESSIASSMLTSITCAPFSTCWRATASASGVVAGEDQPRERLRAGDVGALADVDEERVVADVDRLQAREAQAAARSRASCAARSSARASAIARMCSGVVPQQPPAMLSQPARAHSREQRAAIDSGRARRTRRTRSAGPRSGGSET